MLSDESDLRVQSQSWDSMKLQWNNQTFHCFNSICIHSQKKYTRDAKQMPGTSLSDGKSGMVVHSQSIHHSGNLLFKSHFQKHKVCSCFIYFLPIVRTHLLANEQQRIYLQCRRCRTHGLNPWIRKIPWRRKWQHTLVFLPGKSHGQIILSMSHKELDITELLSTYTHQLF